MLYYFCAWLFGDVGEGVKELLKIIDLEFVWDGIKKEEFFVEEEVVQIIKMGGDGVLALEKVLKPE